MGFRRLWFAGAATAGAVIACHSENAPDGDSGAENHEQRPRETAGECSLAYEDLPDCPDGWENMGGAGGAGGAGSLSDCLLKQVATLSCPSYASNFSMARGVDSALDVLVGQQGRDGRDGSRPLLDTDVYVDTLRLAASDTLIRSQRRTYPQDTFPKQLLLPAGASHDTLKAHLSANEPLSLQLTAPFDESDPPINIDLDGAEPTDLVVGADRGTTVLGLLTEETAVTLVDGVLEEPRLLHLPTGATSLAVTPDESGAALGVTLVDDTLELWRAADPNVSFWTATLDQAKLPPHPELDLLSYPWNDDDAAAVLYPQDGDVEAELVSLVLSGAHIRAPGVATHASTCDLWTVGIVCNRCQVGKSCGTTDDRITHARLLRSHGRLFVVYVAERDVVEKEVELSTSDFFGLGCICQAKKLAEADPTLVLSIKELTVAENETVLSVTDRGSWILGSLGLVHVAFGRAQEGQIDVAVGPPLQPPDLSISDFPTEPIVYRIYHISAN